MSNHNTSTNMGCTMTEKSSVKCIIVLLVSLLSFGILATTGIAAQPVKCDAIGSLKLPHTSIDHAEKVAAGAFEAPAPGFSLPADYSRLPEFCRVAGSIQPSADSDIQFELWLPISGWNGKFMQTGNGGAAGSIVYDSLVEPLMGGYAVANTDTGHQGGAGDFSWASDHPEKYKDYAYRAVHELTVVGKAITTAYYGQAPVKSYWNGCSTGGRQGLMEAQRYPNDYDAIIAGAPANNWEPLMSLSILIQRELTSPDGLGFDKLALLKKSGVEACDTQDGVKDGVIGEPNRCRFDPGSLLCKEGETSECLSASEVASARRIYAGVVDKKGKVFIPGTGPGSEPTWAAYASPQFSFGTNYFRSLVARDPNWSPHTFDVDTDLARATRVDNGVTAAMDPDLRKFFAKDGKLLLYHGTTDGLIPYGNTVNYYDSVLALIGKEQAENNIRLYLVPGMDHCSGGDGACVVNWLSALENWDKNGKAPDAIPATRPATRAGMQGTSSTKVFTRPVCPYPKVARYKGNGDPNDASSFSCVMP